MTVDPDYLRLSAQVEEQRAQIVVLANKLHNVVTALVEADGAIIHDLTHLREFVMDSAFGPDPSATQPAEPEKAWDGGLSRSIFSRMIDRSRAR